MHKIYQAQDTKSSLLSGLFCMLFVVFKMFLRVSNNLDPDQAKCFFLPDLGSSYLQTLLADDTRIVDI